MHILWFRRDLRLNDNESVARAAANNAQVLPCFIIDPWFYEQPEVGKARVRFLFESMENLDNSLRNCGSQLYLFEGNSVDILQQLTQQLIQIGHKPKLYFNRDVQVEYGISRDRAIANFYHQLNLEYHIGLNNFLQTDDDRRNQWFDEYYTYVRQSPRYCFGSLLLLAIAYLEYEKIDNKIKLYTEVRVDKVLIHGLPSF
ncbi:MAG: deoxyribodipyrimidine photo-lyase [Scytonema sp. PMC 1069.18]|nr:deoxyribodipyrimidine photo-lyase [Scytonema sp. PMC 1069.18]MEC4886039.1 deoxyribodipyrimidine photo-lyase [Scytonema sp. PMC 1070.18]